MKLLEHLPTTYSQDGRPVYRALLIDTEGKKFWWASFEPYSSDKNWRYGGEVL